MNPIKLMLISLLSFAQAAAASPIIPFKNADHVLSFEVLTDELIHFDYATPENAPNLSKSIPTTPLISKTKFSEVPNVAVSAGGFETARASVSVDEKTLCFSIFDRKQNELLTRACPSQNAQGNELLLDPEQTQNLYGLGEQFGAPGITNGDWTGKIRKPGNRYGNTMTEFGGGHTGNAQFPILYALGPKLLNYAFYLDTVYPYQWDFTVNPWKISQTQTGADPSFRGYFFLGDDLRSLRSAYLELVGRPLVPPKKAFGLWVSEFGYRNWGEIEGHLRTLRKKHFPIDGFVLDLYWFGLYAEHSPTSAMGLLSWDTKNFPNPAKRIARFRDDDGIGLMTIEESYVSSALGTYDFMAKQGYFVSSALTSTPMIFDAWWGKGSGIDWSQPDAGMAWHNQLRKKQLTDLGVTFHWTDLGEPEAWDEHDFYKNPLGVGNAEADAHNLYNFYWDRSIFEGYETNHESQRHFIMSRSGAPGIQRFGAAMWSGDIGSNLRSLAGHLNVQMNMSLSGIDYFGADIGGFNRLATEGDIGDVYSRWLANASWFDVPMRPHADDGSKKNFTAPDRIGDIYSNLANIRTRYELAPFYYSLAHEAYRTGAAVVPPLVYEFQEDQQVRQIADEKMIGNQLLVASSSALGEEQRDVYLPAGDWIDYRSQRWYHSQGQVLSGQSLRSPEGHFQIPVFARAGAILPKMRIDDKSMNILGKRTDGSVIHDLVVRIYASPLASQFKLVEDDGISEAYRSGKFAETSISQVLSAHAGVVSLGARTGTYDGAPGERTFEVEWVAESKAVSGVKWNGNPLKSFSTKSKFERAKSGFFIDGLGVVHAKSPVSTVAQNQTFEFIL